MGKCVYIVEYTRGKTSLTYRRGFFEFSDMKAFISDVCGQFWQELAENSFEIEWYEVSVAT